MPAHPEKQSTKGGGRKHVQYILPQILLAVYSGDFQDGSDFCNLLEVLCNIPFDKENWHI